MIVLITDDFQDTYPFQHTPFCTDRVQKSRIESCFARLESDMGRHREGGRSYVTMTYVSDNNLGPGEKIRYIGVLRSDFYFVKRSWSAGSYV